MPSKSRRQARYFAMLAHDPVKAADSGIPLKTIKEFNRADKRAGTLKRGNKKPK